MLTNSSTPVQMNLPTALDVVPVKILKLTNGNTLNVYGQVDLATSAFVSFAYLTDANGLLITGSEFLTSGFPSALLEFGDGSVGILTEVTATIEEIHLERFSLDALDYGTLLSTDTIERIPSAGNTVSSADIDLLGIERNADGSYELFVGGFFSEAIPGDPIEEFNDGTYQFSVSNLGSITSFGFSNNEKIFNKQNFNSWDILPSGEALVISQQYDNSLGRYILQFQVVDPTVSIDSADWVKHAFNGGALPETNNLNFSELEAQELPGGNFLITWYLDSDNDATYGDGIFFAIIDPTKPVGQSIIVDATPVVITDLPNDLAPFITTQVLSDGSFLIGWIDESTGFLAGQAKVQHFSEGGAPIGTIVELGASGSQEGSITFDELANGEVLVSWGEKIVADVDGIDVMSSTYALDNNLNTITYQQKVFGDFSQLFSIGTFFNTIDLTVGVSSTSFETLSYISNAHSELTGTGFKYDLIGSAGLYSGEITGASYYIGAVETLEISNFSISAALYIEANKQLTEQTNSNLLQAIFDYSPGIYDASTANGAVTTVISYVKADYYATGSAFDDTLEFGTGDDTIFGLDGNDTLRGSEGADTITGNNGNDTITGGNGGDFLYGNRGIDFINPGAGVDLVDGGGSFDRVWYGDSAAGVIVDLTAGTGFGGNAEGDTIINIERVTGSAFGDIITGNGVTNAIKTGAGDDLVFGLGGRDVIELQDGYDEAHGGDANDNILGHAGNDKLFGDDGFDKLFGGLDDDELTGGLDADYFVFQTEGSIGFGLDTILDFENGIDRLDMRQVYSVGNSANTADSFSDFTILVSSIGVKIKFEAGQVVYLDDTTNGITVADIDASDFIFA